MSLIDDAERDIICEKLKEYPLYVEINTNGDGSADIKFHNKDLTLNISALISTHSLLDYVNGLFRGSLNANEIENILWKS